MRSPWIIGPSALLLGAALGFGPGCSSDDETSTTTSSSTSGVGGSGGGGTGGGTGGSAQGGGGTGGGSCTPGPAICISHDTRHVCLDTGSGFHWVDEQCPTGSGCVNGECVVGQCTDECTLNESDGDTDCELYDMATDSWVAIEVGTSTHDRARAYGMWLRRDGLAYGGVGNAAYSDPPAYTTVVSLGGLGDSAIWTGSYLAAEALRLQATGAPVARRNVKELVETLHLWLNVTGEPGLLARFVAPAGATHPVVLGDLDCNSPRCHCGVSYDGDSWDYIGHISRDQYQGVMLGYALAYEALGDGDEATRELIRQDVVELVLELMKDRQVPIEITYNGTPIPAFPATMRFVVLAPTEMNNGAVSLVIDTNSTDDSEMYGFQEFIPNLQDVLKQIPIIGGAVPTIPRAGSAVMLSSFFRVALLVTDSVASYQDEHNQILDYFNNHSGDGGNINDWLNIAKWGGTENTCGEKYYGNNIAMQPLYNLARLEDDAARLAIIRNEVLGLAYWPKYVNTKNSFFSFIYAANVPGHDPAVVTSAAQQLSGFPVPPRYKRAVNLLTDPKYLPHHATCPNQVNHDTAVDVADRVWADFMWQRHPWALVDTEHLALTAPRMDYLAAYWLGRQHQFMADDTPSRCLAWH